MATCFRTMRVITYLKSCSVIGRNRDFARSTQRWPCSRTLSCMPETRTTERFREPTKEPNRQIWSTSCELSRSLDVKREVYVAARRMAVRTDLLVSFIDE